MLYESEIGEHMINRNYMHTHTPMNTCIDTHLSWAKVLIEATAACAQNEYTEYTHICMTNPFKVSYSSFAFASRSLFTDVCAVLPLRCQTDYLSAQVI